MTLVGLHGYTQTGPILAETLGPLFPGLAAVFPDAPFRPASGAEGQRTWWRASDDGSVYEGWPQTRELLDGILRDAGPDVVVLGFSQGAMLASCVAAWSARGELPPVRRVALVAGMLPRAKDLQPLFDAPIAVPSLHVVGRRDPMAPLAPALQAKFAEPSVVEWDGPHVIPTRGSAWEALRSFVLRGPVTDP